MAELLRLACDESFYADLSWNHRILAETVDVALRYASDTARDAGLPVSAHTEAEARGALIGRAYAHLEAAEQAEADAHDAAVEAGDITRDGTPIAYSKSWSA